MEETQLETTGIKVEASIPTPTPTPSERILRNRNYVNQYKNYYEGYANHWKNFMHSRLDNVNHSWDRQHSPFAEFREDSRKVKFNDNVVFHDYIDSESEIDLEEDSSIEESVTGLMNKSFAVNDCDNNLEDSSEMDIVDDSTNVHTLFSDIQHEPQSSFGELCSRKRQEGMLYFEDVEASVKLIKTAFNLRPKAESAHNFLCEKEPVPDLKKSQSAGTFVPGTRKSPKNRVGTPRFLNDRPMKDICAESSQPPSIEISSFGKGDEGLQNEAEDVKKLEEKKDSNIQCIPIHPSPTMLHLETLVLRQNEILSSNMSNEVENKVISQLQSQNDDYHLIDLEIPPSALSMTISPCTKAPRKLKTKLKSHSDANTSPDKLKSPLNKHKPIKKETSVVYIRKENTRLHGHQLFNEIKNQVSRYNVDKKILTTIFNKKFVALLLSGNCVKKSSSNSNATSESQGKETKLGTNKVIAIGSKWASKPDDNVRLTPQAKKISQSTDSKRKEPFKGSSAEPKATSIVTRNSRKETVYDKLAKPRPASRKISDFEKTKTSSTSSIASPKTVTKKSPKKESKEKVTKLSNSKPAIKPTGNVLEADDNKTSRKNLAAKNELAVADAKVKNIEDRSIAPTKIPKPIAKSAKTTRPEPSSVKVDVASSHTSEPVYKGSINHPRSEKTDMLKELTNPNKSRMTVTTNPLTYSSFDRWLMESKRIGNSKTNVDPNSLKLSVGDERELKILRSIKRNPQMLDAYTTYRFGGPLSPTELSQVMRKMI